MKAVLVAAALFAGAALAQAGEMKGMEMDSKSSSQADKNATSHMAMGVVKKVDATSGKVTVAHEPVKTLNWPSMSMVFHAKDKGVLGRLAEGKKVQFEFQQQGKEYVITGVK